MTKPIFIISLGQKLSDDNFQRIRRIIDEHAALSKEYHVLVFDTDPCGNQFHVLNGEFDDIQDLEDYIKELKNEANGKRD
jgi:hypothetical protein